MSPFTFLTTLSDTVIVMRSLCILTSTKRPLNPFYIIFFNHLELSALSNEKYLTFDNFA